MKPFKIAILLCLLTTVSACAPDSSSNQPLASSQSYRPQRVSRASADQVGIRADSVGSAASNRSRLVALSNASSRVKEINFGKGDWHFSGAALTLDPGVVITAHPEAELFFDLDVTVPDAMRMVWDGGKINVDSDNILTINGSFDAPSKLVFSGDGEVRIASAVPDDGFYITTQNTPSDHPWRISPHQGPLDPMWFKGTDIGAKVNAAYAAGRSGTVVQLPGGLTRLSTSIEMNYSVGRDLTLLGNHWVESTLQITADAAIIGIDCLDCDEVVIRNVRCIEVGGSKKSCCMAVGGTTFYGQNLWLGSSKYGLVVKTSGGAIFDTCFIEGGTVQGLIVGTGFGDNSIAGLQPTGANTNASNTTFNNVASFNNQEAVTVAAYYNLFLDPSFTGTFNIGDTITDGSIVGTILSAPEPKLRVTDKGDLEVGDIVTGTNSQATAVVTHRTDVLLRFGSLSGYFELGEPITSPGRTFGLVSVVISPIVLERTYDATQTIEAFSGTAPVTSSSGGSGTLTSVYAGTVPNANFNGCRFYNNSGLGFRINRAHGVKLAACNFTNNDGGGIKSEGCTALMLDSPNIDRNGGLVGAQIEGGKTSWTGGFVHNSGGPAHSTGVLTSYAELKMSSVFLEGGTPKIITGGTVIIDGVTQ